MSNRSLDCRARRIWYDGNLMPWDDVHVHVLTHSLHYGSAVFEGERAYDGRVFELTAHSERLVASATQIGIHCPYDVTTLQAATNAVVIANSLSDGYIRPLCWLGDEETNVAGRGCTVHVAIAAWEWPNAFGAAARTNGIRLALSPWRRPSPESAPHQAKAAGLYLLGMMSRRAAEVKGYDDALLLDYRGCVAEATGANLFIVTGETVITPVADCILAGITRRIILELAHGLHYRIEIRPVTLDELRKADEVFLTGTAYEITPVCSVDEVTYRVGTVTRALMVAFERLVRAPPKTTTDIDRRANG
jgi:branched-chain amino acid aminotransferase